MKLLTIPRSQIKVGPRYREIFGDLEGLAHSMKKKGIISPLAVQELGPDEYFLLAGERRLKASELAGIDQIPVRVFDTELTELEMREIELAENFQRKDMEWKEQVALQREIHRLEIAIHGEKFSTAPDATGWTQQDTANMIGVSRSALSEALKLGEAVEQFPELFDNCKTQADARKTLKRMEEAILVSELAKKVESRTTINGADKLKHDLINAYMAPRDFFEGVREIPDGVIDLVEIDPPYAIDLEQIKRDYVYGDTYNEVSSKDYPNFLDRTLRESYRIMAEHSWLIFWFGQEPWFEVVYQAISRAGFTGTRMFGTWVKPTGQSQQPHCTLANCTEIFFYARKGNPVLAKQGRSSVFHYSPVPAQSKTHPTERPKELMAEILSTFAFPGAKLAVPFAGSGVTLIEGARLGMKPIGWDLTKQYRDSYILKVHQMEV